MDYSFKINHLSFGKQEDFAVIQDKFAKVGVVNPLDGVNVDADRDGNN